MKLTKAVHDALNDQLNLELHSSYLYFGMSAYLEGAHCSGLANWMRIQSQEEHGHAMKIYSYLAERDAKIAIGALAAPKASYSSLVDVFKETLKAEERVSDSCNKLTELALKEKDYATAALMQWFVTEQVEEERNARKALAVLDKLGQDPIALFEFDRGMGKRGA